MTLLLSFNCFSQDRWRFFEDNKWDTRTAKKLDSRKVKFFYEYQYMEEQRQFLIRNGMSSQLVSEIKYGQTGAILNCATFEYGIFSVSLLNNNRIPVEPPASVPLNETKLEPISPDSVMEGLFTDVCKFFKMNKQ